MKTARLTATLFGRIRIQLGIVLLALVLGLVFRQPVPAAVKFLGDPATDYVTITNAIHHAGPGQVILVSTGTYFEAVNIVNKTNLVIDGQYNDDCTAKVPDGTTQLTLPFLALRRVASVQNSSVHFIDIDFVGGWPFGGEALQGSGLYVFDGSQVNLTGCQVYNNTANGYGGGIYVHNASLILSNSFVFSNEARNATAGLTPPPGRGGGIAANNGEIEITATTFSRVVENFAEDIGGGVYLENGSRLMISGMTDVISNSALNSGGGIAATDHSHVEVLNSVWISGNEAVLFDGGGIWVDNVSTCVVRGASVRIGFNSPIDGPNRSIDGNGGGIFVRDSVLDLAGAAVAHNYANRVGGGIYLTNSVGVISNASIGWSHDFVHTNRSNRGGGIAALNSTLTLVSNVIVHGNSAAFGGGGLYLRNSTGTLNAAQIRHNWAGNSGGGLEVFDGILDVRNSHIHHNVAHAGDGGGGVLRGTPGLFEGGGISNNTAGTRGGGILASFSPVMMTNVLVRNNHASGDGGGLALSYAWHVNDPPSSLDRVTFEWNTADRHGGGVWITNAVVLMDGIEIRNNRADLAGGVSYGSGGGICAAGGHGVWLSSDSAPSLIEWNSGREGGGIHASGGATVTVTRGMSEFMFLNNVATNRGGGLHVREAVLSVTGPVVLMQNRAGESGGGVYLFSSEARLADNVNIGWLYGNEAGHRGGGIAANVSTTTLDLVHFQNNEAYRDGGGMSVLGGRMDGVSVTFSTNSAGRSGGGLYLDQGAYLIATNLNLLGNIADSDLDDIGDGGGLAVVGNSWAMLDTTGYGDSMVHGNRGSAGGGMYVSNATAICAGNIRVEENVATGLGGGLAMDSATSTISRVYFLRNEAAAYGGGIHAAHDSLLSMDNSLVAESVIPLPGAGAGGVHIQDSRAEISMCTVVSNVYSGVEVFGTSAVSLNECLVYYHSHESVTPGQTVEYSNIEGGYVGVGNFAAHPLLYGATYHLTAWSPCRGAGRPAGVDERDVDGEERTGNLDVGFDQFVDSDGDGLPDIVETGTGIMVSDLDMGTDPNNPDTSGNGMSDGDAWLAGLNPNDPDSRLEMLGAEQDSTGMKIHWRGGTTAYQMFEYRTNLVTGVWQQYFMAIPPTPAINTLVYDGPEDAVNFRIRASRFGF